MNEILKQKTGLLIRILNSACVFINGTGAGIVQLDKVVSHLEKVNQEWSLTDIQWVLAHAIDSDWIQSECEKPDFSGAAVWITEHKMKVAVVFDSIYAELEMQSCPQIDMDGCPFDPYDPGDEDEGPEDISHLSTGTEASHP